MRWKQSRFNIYVPSENQVVFAANTLSRAIVCFSATEAIAIQKNTFEDTDLQDNTFSHLVSNRILVQKDIDEISIFQTWFERIKCDLSEIRATIALTSACNLACEYCFQKGTFQDKPVTVTKDTADNFVNWLVDFAENANSSSVVVLFYGGEPTLVPEHMIRIADQSRKLIGSRRHLTFGIYTNAVNIPNEIMSLFNAKDFKFAQVSIDGPPNVHNRRRSTKSGKPTFYRVIDNIKSMLRCNISVRIVINFDKDNAPDVPALLDFISKDELLRTADLAFNPVFVTEGNNPYCAVHCPSEDRSYALWQTLYREAADRPLKVNPLRLLFKGPCSFHRNGHIFVSPEGNIFECIGLIGTDTVSSGNINSGFVWDDLRIREMWVNRHSKFRDECLACCYLPICLGGCRFKALCETGSLAGRVCHKELIEKCEIPLIPEIHKFLPS